MPGTAIPDVPHARTHFVILSTGGTCNTRPNWPVDPLHANQTTIATWNTCSWAAPAPPLLVALVGARFIAPAWSEVVNVPQLVEHLLKSRDHSGNIAAFRHNPARPPTYAPLPDGLDPRLKAAYAKC